MSPYNTQNQADSQGKNGIYPIYKKAGETLSVLIKRFQGEELITEDVPITYAGRLDPMADGLVLLLLGETCKQKDSFLGLDKTYTFEIIFGVATDTFDMLGLITEIKDVLPTELEIRKALLEIKDKRVFSYPPFSSRPVNGIPLFMHAKAGTLPDVMPEMKGEIKNIVLKDIKSTSYDEIIERSLEIVQRVEGDFRQVEIIKGWKKFLEEVKDKKCIIAKCEATVSSGVYIRSIAVNIGRVLGAPALAYSITRTKVGNYQL